MKLKNKSSRGHWVGDVLLAPGATASVDDVWRNAYNKTDLEEVAERNDEVVIEAAEVEVKTRGRKAKVEAVEVTEPAAE